MSTHKLQNRSFHEKHTQPAQHLITNIVRCANLSLETYQTSFQYMSRPLATILATILALGSRAQQHPPKRGIFGVHLVRYGALVLGSLVQRGYEPIICESTARIDKEATIPTIVAEMSSKTTPQGTMDSTNLVLIQNLLETANRCIYE